MTCNRVLLGILLFQLTTAGQLALKGAVKRSFVVVPLLIATVWFWLAYNRTYRPLMNFIALKSIRQSSDDGSEETSNEDSVAAETSVWRDAENGREYQTERSGKNDEGNKFEYPGLTSP